MIGEKVPSFIEDDEELKQREYELLDSDYILSNHDKLNLVGLREGLKQAAELVVHAEEADVDATEDDIEEMLTLLDLVYYKEEEGDLDYAPGYVCIQYYAAKTQEVLDEMREINRQSAEGGDLANEAERERGRLFGFPETAIDYYINEWDPETSPNPDDSNPKYHSYIHSPEHAEEEYEQYEKKLDALFREYCPQSAAELLGEE